MLTARTVSHDARPNLIPLELQAVWNVRTDHPRLSSKVRWLRLTLDDTPPDPGVEDRLPTVVPGVPGVDPRVLLGQRRTGVELVDMRPPAARAVHESDSRQ